MLNIQVCGLGNSEAFFLKMNNKFIAIIIGTVVISFFTGFLAASQKPTEGFEIHSQDDLTTITNELTRGIANAKIFLNIADIAKMVGPDLDMDVITLFPNEMNGISTSHGNFTNYKHYTKYFENGTRVYTELDHNGKLLKEIRIYDVPEKTIMTIIKEND